MTKGNYKRDEIPKIIHYCWFGKTPLSEGARKCISSWKIYCPEYEIKEWNESNFDLECCDYVKEAYSMKKWAFVSDYARFKILYEFGGLYFDTDVELIKPMEPIIKKGPFLGFEENPDPGRGAVAPGLGMGAVPGMKLNHEMIKHYQSLHFLNKDGSPRFTTVVVYMTDLLYQYGMKREKGIQTVEGISIYPSEFFCPKNYKTGEMNVTEHTYSIHHYSESWLDEVTKKIHKQEAWFRKKYGRCLGNLIGHIVVIPLKMKRKILNRKYSLRKKNGCI